MKDSNLTSLIDIIKFNNVVSSVNGIKIGEIYGKERFCYLLYSLIRMEQPNVVVELGTGLGTSALLSAQALKENNKGKIWTIDNGEDWEKYKNTFDKVFETHKEYFNELIKKFNLTNFIELVSNFDTSKNLVYNPKSKVDIVFADAMESGPTGCLQVLRGYLPIMSSRSSIFIDRASTINHSYLFLEYVIKELQKNRVVSSLVEGLPKKTQESIYRLVSNSKFTLIHLVEDDHNKVNKNQNSTAWIKIEPLDFIFGGNVLNIVSQDPFVNNNYKHLITGE